MTVKFIKDVNINLIKNEVNLLFEKYPFLKKQSQISLQSFRENGIIEEDWKCSIGKMDNLSRKETDYKYPLFPELDIINHYLEQQNAYRSRLMISSPKTCMTIHQDASPRIHIPVTTNPNCIMIIDDIVYRLEEGKMCWTDTTKFHTAVNASHDYRIHIVGCVKP